MKSIKIILFLLSFAQLVSAQSIQGTILEEGSNEPIIGASIYFPDLKTGAITDTAGIFMMQKLPKGKFVAQISALGYGQKVITLTSPDNTILVYLTHSVTEMQSMVVTGVSATTEIRRSPVPIVAISPKFLQQNSATNIIDAIGKIPGVSNLSTGPNVSKPYIRGLGYNRVLTLFDGVRQDGQQWGDEHGIEIDQNLIDKIEVIKGPASLMYGSDALAGVINLLPTDPLPEGQIKGEISNNYQTNNLQIGNSVALVGNNRGITWGFRASHKQAADYKNKYDGRVFGTKYKETDLNANIGLNKKWGYSYLNFSIYDDLQEIPDGSRDSVTRQFTKQISENDSFRPVVSQQETSSYDIGIIHQHVQHYRVYSASNFILGDSRLAIKLGYQQSIRREFGHPEYPALPALFLTLKNFTYDVKYFLPTISKIEMVVGINGMAQNNSNDGATEFVIPNYHSFDIGVFFHAKKSFGKLDISVGSRYDIRKFNNAVLYTKINSATGFYMQVPYNQYDASISKQFDAYTHTFSGFSGSVGATYNFNKNFCLKANLARGYRAPNIAEISAKGVHPGTGFMQLGDENFKPEFSLQGDIGLFYYNQHVSLSAELFYNRLSNYIFNQKLEDSIFVQNGVSYPVFKFQQTTAQLYGGEFSVDIHAIDLLHFENSISLLYANNLGGNGVIITDATKYLPLIPPLHTNHEIRAEFKPKVSFLSDSFIKFGVQYYAAQNRIFSENGTETPTAGYTLIDAGIGTSFVNKKGNKVFIFSILGNNLADIAYQSNMSRLKYFDNFPVNSTGRSGIYNMGRNIAFKLIIPIDIK